MEANKWEFELDDEEYQNEREILEKLGGTRENLGKWD